MIVREIPRAEWRDFLDRFGRQHRAWLTTVAVSAEGGGAALPLQHVAFDGGAGGLRIELGEGSERVVVDVRAPVRLRLLEVAPGAHVGLEIETADGVTTSLRFRVAALPETVDGIA